MDYAPINFGKKLGLYDERWQPKVIAEMNDYQFKSIRRREVRGLYRSGLARSN